MQGWQDPEALVPGSAVQKQRGHPWTGTKGWSQVPGHLPPTGPRHPQPHCAHSSAPPAPALGHPNAASLRGCPSVLSSGPLQRLAAGDVPTGTWHSWVGIGCDQHSDLVQG